MEGERAHPSQVSRNLVDGALATGATRVVQEALAFIYVDTGNEWVDENAPIDGGSFNRGVHYAEEQVARFTDRGGVGVVLRFGLFHASDSEQTRQAVSLARRGLAMTLGKPDAYLSMIEIDDAAQAVLVALGADAGVYNVVNDEPFTRRHYAAALSDALNRAKPLRLPPALMSKLGGAKTALLARSERVSNRRIREATDWTPKSPSAREAWKKIASELDRCHGGAMSPRPDG